VDVRKVSTLSIIRNAALRVAWILRYGRKAHRYQYRLEESYKIETNAHVRGDGRWFVEILCQNGLIYPHGRTVLLACAKAGVCPNVSKVADTDTHQTDNKAHVFRFPLERLDQVAAILKPRKRPTYSQETLDAKREQLRAARERQKALIEIGQINI